jgi:hypothetical protein
MITVKQPTESDIRFVLHNMRELDRRELKATGCMLEELPRRILLGSVFVFVAVDGTIPHAVWGLMATRNGVGTGFAFGDKYWGKALPAMLRNIRSFVLPLLLRQNFHRVECLALSHRKDVERFLGLIGAYPEAVLRQWGAGGEDFTSYRWLADEYRSARHSTVEDRHVAH